MSDDIYSEINADEGESVEVSKWKRPSTRLTVEEQTIILRLHKEGVSQSEIARQIERDHSAISRFLKRFFGTTELAQAYIQANALNLAKKVVKHATVEEAVDILSRPNIGVLQPHKTEKSGPQILISFGQDSIGGIESRSGGSPNETKGLTGTPERAKLIGSGASVNHETHQTRPENRADHSEGPSAARASIPAAQPDAQGRPPASQRRTRAPRDSRTLKQKVARILKGPRPTFSESDPPSRPIPSSNRSKVNMRYSIVEEDD